MMIVINKDSTNLVALSLTNRTLQTPYYLFQFTNEQTGEEVLFNAEDTSSYQCRYNLFDIIETGVTFINYTAGTINLALGTWDYNVYETSASTLVISACTNTSPIDNGRVVVIGDTAFFTSTTINSIYL